MTNPINIYIQSRINDKEVFDRIESHATGRACTSNTKQHEIESLSTFVNKLVSFGISLEELDGFFWSFSIPQISKEFDLLKFTESSILNIELKSQSIEEEKMKKQLLSNKYYLNPIKKKINLFIVITDTMTCYTLRDGNLETVEFDILVNTIHMFGESYIENVDSMFRVSNYLISPLNTPDRFLRHEYFLTEQQQVIKKQILDKEKTLSECGYFALTGNPGTGKTLLLYDLARDFANIGQVLIVHCGKMANGQNEISIQNLKIVSANSIENDSVVLVKSKYILVDEAQRIHMKQFDAIKDSVVDNKQICVFSYDKGQVLSHAEENNAMWKKFEELAQQNQFKLTNKIRSNQELASFISSVRDLSKIPYGSFSYNNVTLSYANDVDEAKKIIKYYRSQGYIFINYSKSNFNHSPYKEYEEDYDTHHVIGQEFDNVLLAMDESFYYNEAGKLQGKEHPNPDYLYPKLFYQGASRVREKLAIVVVDAPDLFNKISSIFDRKKTLE